MLPALTTENIELIRRCLLAATEGPYFPDWEFQTLIGRTREEMRSILASWPNVRDLDEVRTIRCVIGHLFGYPHRKQAIFQTETGLGYDELVALAGSLGSVLGDSETESGGSPGQREIGWWIW